MTIRKNTLFSSPALSVGLQVNPCTLKAGTVHVLADLNVEVAGQRTIEIRKYEGVAPKNSHEIAEAKRAVELGLEVEVPEPVNGTITPAEEVEALALELTEELQRMPLDSCRLGTAFEALRALGYNRPERMERHEWIVRGESGQLERWSLAEHWSEGLGCGWESFRNEERFGSYHEELGPQLFGFLERLYVFLQQEEAGYRDEQRQAEREMLRQKFGIPADN